MPNGRRFLRAASLVSVLTLALVLPRTNDAAPSPAAKCTITKRGAAARKVVGKLSCVTRAMTKGGPVDGACLAKAESKFSSTFAKADAKGGCISTGDAASVEASVDACVGAIRSQLGVPGSPVPAAKCTQAKVKAAGKKTQSKIACHNAGVSKGIAASSTCLSKVESAFVGAFAKAETKGGCLTTGDAAAVEADVDNCVNSFRSGIPEPSTTTTSTTTSTTSTTVCTDTAPGPYLSNITALHNDQRNGSSPPVPAPNPPLAPMCWLNSVASTAQGWANMCQWAHNPGNGSLGENIYGICGDQRATAASGAVASWASEQANYTYASSGGGTCAGCNLYDSCGLGSNCTSTCCLHYTQVVWRSSVRLGCGIQLCNSTCPFNGSFPNWTIVVCNYQPGGNFIGQSPY
jgi:hypothetical protein